MKKIIIVLIAIIAMSCAKQEDCKCEVVTDVQVKGMMSKGSPPTIISGDGTEGDPYITDLSGMSKDIKIDAKGEHYPHQFWKTIGDVNLNGYKLEVHHIQLAITGNLNGSGELKIKAHTRVCVAGSIQNNPKIKIDKGAELLENTDCSSTLGVDDVEYNICPKGQEMICD